MDREHSREWLAETLRLTAFPEGSVEQAAASWWEAATGEPLETRTSRPKDRFLQEEGPFGDHRLVLTVQPQRIDWNWNVRAPSAEELASEGSVRALGLFGERADAFAQLMSRWLPLSPPLQRLAFGTTLLMPAGSREDGYRQLAPYLKNSVEVDPSTSDLVYQINRRRRSQSGISGLEINRLSQWSVVVGERARLSVDMTGKDPKADVVAGSQWSACRLVLDINTAPGFQPGLPSTKLPELFQELVSLGKEIAVTGDIP